MDRLSPPSRSTSVCESLPVAERDFSAVFWDLLHSATGYRRPAVQALQRAAHGSTKNFDLPPYSRTLAETAGAMGETQARFRNPQPNCYQRCDASVSTSSADYRCGGVDDEEDEETLQLLSIGCDQFPHAHPVIPLGVTSTSWCVAAELNDARELLGTSSRSVRKLERHLHAGDASVPLTSQRTSVLRSDEEKRLLRLAQKRVATSTIRWIDFYGCFKSLDLTRRNLSSLTPELEQFSALKVLILSSNPALSEIRYLPPCIMTLIANGCRVTDESASALTAPNLSATGGAGLGTSRMSSPSALTGHSPRVCLPHRSATVPKAAEKLMVLGLACNPIRSMQFISTYPSLRLLDLSWTHVFCLACVVTAVSSHPTLEELSLLGSPVTLVALYRKQMIRHCGPRLARLDDVYITEEERGLALASTSSSAASRASSPHASDGAAVGSRFTERRSRWPPGKGAAGNDGRSPRNAVDRVRESKLGTSKLTGGLANLAVSAGPSAVPAEAVVAAVAPPYHRSKSKNGQSSLGISSIPHAPDCALAVDASVPASGPSTVAEGVPEVAERKGLLHATEGLYVTVSLLGMINGQALIDLALSGADDPGLRQSPGGASMAAATAGAVGVVGAGPLTDTSKQLSPVPAAIGGAAQGRKPRPKSPPSSASVYSSVADGLRDGFPDGWAASMCAKEVPSAAGVTRHCASLLREAHFVINSHWMGGEMDFATEPTDVVGDAEAAAGQLFEEALLQDAPRRAGKGRVSPSAMAKGVAGARAAVQRLPLLDGRSRAQPTHDVSQATTTAAGGIPLQALKGDADLRAIPGFLPLAAQKTSRIRINPETSEKLITPAWMDLVVQYSPVTMEAGLPGQAETAPLGRTQSTASLTCGSLRPNSPVSRLSVDPPAVPVESQPLAEAAPEAPSVVQETLGTFVVNFSPLVAHGKSGDRARGDADFGAGNAADLMRLDERTLLFVGENKALQQTATAAMVSALAEGGASCGGTPSVPQSARPTNPGANLPSAINLPAVESKGNHGKPFKARCVPQQLQHHKIAQLHPAHEVLEELSGHVVEKERTVVLCVPLSVNRATLDASRSAIDRIMSAIDPIRQEVASIELFLLLASEASKPSSAASTGMATGGLPSGNGVTASGGVGAGGLIAATVSGIDAKESRKATAATKGRAAEKMTSSPPSPARMSVGKAAKRTPPPRLTGEGGSTSGKSGAGAANVTRGGPQNITGGGGKAFVKAMQAAHPELFCRMQQLHSVLSELHEELLIEEKRYAAISQLAVQLVVQATTSYNPPSVAISPSHADILDLSSYRGRRTKVTLGIGPSADASPPLHSQSKVRV